MRGVRSQWKKKQYASHVNQSRAQMKPRNETITMNEPSLRPSSVWAAIFRHVQEFWPNTKIFETEWQEGPIQKSLPGFKVLTVSPETPQQPLIYVTSGCFLGEPDE